MTATASQAEKSGPAAEPKVGWSHPVARPGDVVYLGAVLVGYPADSDVTFKVFEAGEDPGSAMATLKATTDKNGLAIAKWTVQFDHRRQQVPLLLFEASTPESSAISPGLMIVDGAILAMQEEGGNELAGLTLDIVDSRGEIHRTKIPAGGAIDKTIPVGEFQLLLKDHLIVGEESPGQRTFATGKAHDVTWRKMVYTVEFTSFQDGEVVLAGDRLPVETIVKRAGNEEDVEPKIVVSGGGELLGGGASQSGQSAQRGGGDSKPVIQVGDEEGELSVEASYGGAKATARLKVIRPYVRRIELVDDGGNLVELFDHQEGGAKPASYEFHANGGPAKVHPGAVKFGTKLKAKVSLFHEEKPARPAHLELALISQKLDDKGLAAPGEKKLANRPLVLRLPEAKRDGGVEVSGDWDGEVFELEANRPLPMCIRENLLKLEARVRVKGEGGWSKSADKPKTWACVSRLAEVPVFGIWKKPEVGEGTQQKPGDAPLKKSELDAFHLHHACTWADGGFNLLPDHDGSILKRLVANIGHYRYPEGYDGKEGKPASAHKRPDNVSALTQKGISTGEVEDREPPKADDKLEVEIARRGGKERRNAATDFTIKVVTNGALEVEIEPDDSLMGPVKFQIRVDGKDRAETGYIAGGKSSGRIDVGPVAPGPHVVTLSPEIGGKFPKLAGWRGKAVVHFTKPKPGEGKPQEKNWGFGVLDNPQTPGGRSHQAASVVAAALNVLGVKAAVNMIEAREGGAINLVSHDPVTVGASCFDPEKHWGQNVIAFTAVPVDDSRDGDDGLKDLKPLHADKTLVIDLGGKKIVPVDEATKTGHARRMPKRDRLARKQCRCGEPWPPEGWVDWVARIESGVPFDLVLNEVPATKEQWGTLKPGGTYSVRFVGPDTYVATGPANKEVELSASLDGKLWSFSEWPSGKGKRGHGGKLGKHKLRVDQSSGVITAALSGGKGQYTVRFYKNRKQVGPDVATCRPSLRRLRLTKEAEKAGWKRQGTQLVPPPDLAEGNVGVTATYKDANTVPSKFLINLWGHPLRFDNSGALTDPEFPELGVVGTLKGEAIQPFGAGEHIVHATHPIRMLAKAGRRWHHWLTHKVETFETEVETEGLLKVLPAVPQGPRFLNVHFRIFIDGKLVGSQVLPAQKPRWIEKKVAKGTHKIRVQAFIRGHGPAPGGITAAVTIETSKKNEPLRRHPISNAQPCWAYKVDGKLKDALIQSIIYPCPKCGVTVHEEDDDCWACGQQLEKRDVTEGWLK